MKTTLKPLQKLKRTCTSLFRKVIPDQRQTCLIYGNCQAPNLASILRSWAAFNAQYKILPISPVHKIRQVDLDRLLETIPKIDVFIHQPISNSYRSMPQLSTSFLTTQLKENSHPISFPSLYFSGYSPEVIYIRKVDGICHPSPAKNYHSLYIVKSYLSGKSIKDTSSLLKNRHLLDSELSRQIVEGSLSELQQRETNLSIHISSFIEQTYKRRRLFHTMNHPSIIVFKQVALQIIQQLKLTETPDEKWLLSGTEILDSNWFPIHPSTYQNLGLTFDNAVDFTLMSHVIPMDEAIASFFQFYDQNPQIIHDFEQSQSRFSTANVTIEKALTDSI